MSHQVIVIYNVDSDIFVFFLKLVWVASFKMIAYKDHWWPERSKCLRMMACLCPPTDVLYLNHDNSSVAAGALVIVKFNVKFAHRELPDPLIDCITT